LHADVGFYNLVDEYSQKALLLLWDKLDSQLVYEIINNLDGTVAVPRNDGDSFCLMKIDFYLQYITHTIYHRGQLNYCLNKLKKPRIEGDYLYYFDEIDTKLDEKI
jgi:uncharacterized damage-inducible protein DinB